MGFNAADAGAYLIAKNVSLGRVKLPKTILWGANLENANLEESNFTEASFHRAVLKKANIQRANLKKAKFRNANLEGAKFDNAIIETASFGDTLGLTVEQIKSAENWRIAEYSQSFREQIGLSP